MTPTHVEERRQRVAGPLLPCGFMGLNSRHHACLVASTITHYPLRYLADYESAVREKVRDVLAEDQARFLAGPPKCPLGVMI